MSITLGSLFDGIGGFPLAAQRHGITPAWASEIEAAPVSITKKHFPEMLHLGNITEISGAEIEPVDIITFGSPCQDLSVAGNRAGLDGERSGLFMEAVRIIREMREATNGVKPRWCVWENVHGAFSSSGGRDFLAVIREVAETVDKDIHVPRPPTADGVIVWQPAGAAVGDGGSLAWRVLDAQYWGVPQRRRRIFLVADFGGGRAGEVLFKPESLPGNHAAGGETGEGTAAAAERGAGTTGGGNAVAATICAAYGTKWNGNAGAYSGDNFVLDRKAAPTPRGGEVGDKRPAVVVLNDQGGDSMNVESGDVSPCLRAETHGNLPIVLPIHDKATRYKGGGDGRNDDGASNGLGIGADGDPFPTLDTSSRHAVAYTPSSFAQYAEGVGTLKANGGDLGGGSETLVFAMQGFGDYKESESASAIKSRDYKDSTDLVGRGCAVRRLTPTECERLQGFPDGWTAYGHDGEPIFDTQRYKALGNSVAIPCVDFIMGNIAKIMEAR